MYLKVRRSAAGRLPQSGMEQLTANPPLPSEHGEHWTNECVTTNKCTHTESRTERNDTRCCTREGGKGEEKEEERGEKKERLGGDLSPERGGSRNPNRAWPYRRPFDFFLFVDSAN